VLVCKCTGDFVGMSGGIIGDNKYKKSLMAEQLTVVVRTALQFARNGDQHRHDVSLANLKKHGLSKFAMVVS